MGATQIKIVSEIKNIVKKIKLDADFEWAWSNVGRCYFRKGFKTIANMSLDFQDGHLTASFKRGETKSEYFGNNDKIFYIEYTKGDDIINFLNFVKTNLKGRVS